MGFYIVQFGFFCTQRYCVSLLKLIFISVYVVYLICWCLVVRFSEFVVRLGAGSIVRSQPSSASSPSDSGCYKVVSELRLTTMALVICDIGLIDK